MAVTVEPAEFRFVDFDADVIASLASDLAESAGLGDVEVRIEIDESSALGHTDLASIDPVRITLQSGALEDPKAIRQLSVPHASDVLGRYLLRAADRRNPSFGDPPAEDDLTLAQRTAWDVYAAGRVARTGVAVHQQRWRYAFRNRHGFTDVADVAFDRLWDGEGLTWDQIAASSAEAEAANPGPLQR